MRFLHLGDLHLGKTLGDFELIDDQRYMLNQLLQIAREQRVDAVLIAGDVYDKSIPSEAAVGLLDDFLNRLAGQNLPTYLITGNHDSDERLHFGSSLFAARGIHIAAKYQGQLWHQTLEDDHGTLHIYLMPFMKASQVRYYFPEEEINNYDDAVRVVLAKAKVNPLERNLLVAHQFVAGKSKDPVLAGSENMGVQNVGTVEKVGADCFDGMDYVALGHIHSPQQVGRETVRYAGSPLKYSLSEVNNEKAATIVTLGPKGTVEVELIALHPRRDLRHLKGRMEQLLDAAKSADNTDNQVQDYIYATFTDEDVIGDAMLRFQQTYPNTVKIDYDNTRTKELDQVDVSQITKGKSFTELFSDFYRQVYGSDITEEELAVIEEVSREAGVADETH